MSLRHLAFSSLGLLLALPVRAEEYSFPNPFGGDKFTNPNEIIATIVGVALGFLGIVVLVIMIYAGFLWMTAGGAEDSISKAKKIFLWTVVGMVVILGSYAILDFVFDALITATA